MRSTASSLGTHRPSLSQGGARVTATDLLFATLAAVTVLIPFIRLPPYALLYDAQRIFVVVVFSAGALVLCTRGGAQAVRDGLDAVPPVSRLTLLVVLILGLVSAALAPMVRYAATEIGVLAAIVGAAVALAGRWRETPRAGRQAVQGLALACAVGYAGAVLWGYATVPREKGTLFLVKAFGNGRFLGQIQIVLLPLLLGLAVRLRQSGATARWAVRVMAGFHLAVLIASGGRAALLALVVGSACVLLILGRRARPLALEAGWALGCGAALYLAMFSGGEAAVAGSVHSTFQREAGFLNGRGDLWAAALRMVEDRPWLGVGPMHFAYFGIWYGAHPHNAVLQLASEWGLPVAVLVTGLVVWGAIACLRALRRSSDDDATLAWRATLVAALVGSLVSAMFDSFLMLPVAQLWGVVLLGALLAEFGRPGGRTPRGTTPPRWRALVALAALMAVSPMFSVVIADAPSLGRRYYDRHAWSLTRVKNPRFWRVGTIAPPQGPEQAWVDRYWPAFSEHMAQRPGVNREQ